MKFIGNTSPSELIGEGGKLTEVVLQDGTRIPADVIIAGIGKLPQYRFSLLLSLHREVGLMVFSHQSKTTTRQRHVGPGVKGIIGMHRFNICLVVVLSLSCSGVKTPLDPNMK